MFFFSFQTSKNLQIFFYFIHVYFNIKLILHSELFFFNELNKKFFLDCSQGFLQEILHFLVFCKACWSLILPKIFPCETVLYDPSFRQLSWQNLMTRWTKLPKSHPTARQSLRDSSENILKILKNSNNSLKLSK